MIVFEELSSVFGFLFILKQLRIYIYICIYVYVYMHLYVYTLALIEAVLSPLFFSFFVVEFTK